MSEIWTCCLPPFLRKKVEGRADLQKVIGNTGWLFFDKILRMGVGLIVGAWVARYLGPDQFGLMNYVGSFVTILSVFATLGLDSIVVRDIVNDVSCRDDILGSAFVLKFVGGVFTFILSMLTIFFLRSGDTLAYWLVGILASGTIFQAFDTIDFWFQSQVKSKYTVYARNVAFMAVALIRVVLISVKAPLVAFAVANITEIAFSALGLVIVYKQTGLSIFSWKLKINSVGKLLKDSWPLVLTGVVIMIYMRIDQVMIGQMVGDHEVGIYSAAVRLAEVWYFIPMAVSASVFPSVVEAKSLGDVRFYKRLQKFYNVMALVGYSIAVPVTVLSGWLVKIVYGQSYSKAGPMLMVLIWAGLFVNLGVARASFLTAMNWTKVYFITVLLGGIVNIALNLILIPKYGGLGASIATLVAYWVASQGSCFIYKPLFKTGRMLTRALLYPRIW